MTQAKSTLRETPLPIPTLCKADGKQLTLDLENMSQSAGPSSQRRKTTEACSPCRARKLKCNGMLPCESCEKNKAQCAYDPSTSASRLTGDLDIMNARIMELERAVFGERTYQPRKTVELPDPPQTTNDTVSGVTFIDDKTGTVDYFGPTSTIVLLKSFHEKFHPTFQEIVRGFQRPRTNEAGEPASKRQRRGNKEIEIDSDPLQSFRVQEIYTSSTVSPATNWCPDENIDKAHRANFFHVIHNTFPMLDKKSFRAKLKRLETASTSLKGQQAECLTYSVYALGALYTPPDFQLSPDGTLYAARYFAEAQSLLGSLLGVSSLKIVQAALLMAVYAHYTADHRLAYNYLGIAIRLAYSAGLNTNFDKTGFTNIAVQEARRTWWILYSFESELCLEYGKPLCIRETDSTAPYPEETLDAGTTVSRFSFIIVMAKFSRIVRKVIDLVSNIDEKRNDVETFAGRLMNLQSELMAWKGALPTNLAFKNPVEIEEMNLDTFVCIDRQRRDIELRFNHVMLVLHRPFFAGTNFSTPFYDSNMARSVCLGAAQDTVLSMHKRLQKIRAVHEWPSGYHRLLAATIVILTIACESPAEEKAQLLETVSKSQELLESMQSVGLGLRVVSTGFYLLSGTLER